MMERILHVGIDATSWANDRGFGRFTRELVTSLAIRHTGFRYTLLFDQMPRAKFPEGVEVLSAATKHGLNESAVGTMSRSIGYLWKLGRAARKAKVDLFFFPTVYSFFPILARVPCVVCYHDMTAERFPELLFPTRVNHRLWQIKTALARFQTTRAMTVSQASATDIERFLGIPSRRIDVISEAADPVFRVLEDLATSAKARARFDIPENAALLVHVGGLNPHKNLMKLLTAMLEVVAKLPHVYLAIVGDTSGKGFWSNAPELKRFVKSDPLLERHIRFTGYISDSMLVELLNGAEALVFPSLCEGFGLPAVEAMSCGIPVLASNSSSLPEVVGDAGLFFDPENPSAIAECIALFLRDPQLRHRLRNIALQRAQTFNWSRAAELAEVCFRRCYDDATRRQG